MRRPSRREGVSYEATRCGSVSRAASCGECERPSPESANCPAIWREGDRRSRRPKLRFGGAYFGPHGIVEGVTCMAVCWNHPKRSGEYGVLSPRIWQHSGEILGFYHFLLGGSMILFKCEELLDRDMDHTAAQKRCGAAAYQDSPRTFISGHRRFHLPVVLVPPADLHHGPETAL
jgi:hypothetical protein